MAEKRHDDAKEPVAEYLKIRQYVIGLVVNAGSESVKIPSMPVLGTQFGVARMTVHKALKDLIKDLYLIVKPGIGIFTNPRRLPEMATGSHHKCVGLVAGRGHYCFYDHYSWLLLSQAGVAASEKGRFVKIINLTSDSPARMAMELRTSWIDGLIWLEPDELGAETLKELKTEAFPVVSLQHFVKGVDGVRLDCEKHGYEVAKAFLAEGRRNAVYIAEHDIEMSALQLRGFRRAYAEAGLKVNDRLVLKYGKNVPDEFDSLLELGVDVQALYVDYGVFLPPVLESLAKHGVDIKNSCRVLANRSDIAGVEDFHGICRTPPFAEAARLAAAKLEELMSGRSAEPAHDLVEIPMERVP